jgi:hypothetical protein
MPKEGRLSILEDVNDNTRPSTNVIPKRMDYEVMIDSYIALYQLLLRDHEIAKRIKNKLRHLGSPVYGSGCAISLNAGWHPICANPGIPEGGRAIRETGARLRLAMIASI